MTYPSADYSQDQDQDQDVVVLDDAHRQAVEDALSALPVRERARLLVATLLEEIAQRDSSYRAFVVAMRRLLQGLLGDERRLRLALVVLQEQRGVVSYYGGRKELGRRLGMHRHVVADLLRDCASDPVLSRLVHCELSEREQQRRDAAGSRRDG